MVFAVLLANLISIRYIIVDTNVAERSREVGVQATVTVAILSASFCLLNTFYILSAAIHLFLRVSLSENFVLKFGIFYAVPLNSALNPLIYFFRKREMREYLLDLLTVPMRYYRMASIERHNQPNRNTVNVTQIALNDIREGLRVQCETSSN